MLRFAAALVLLIPAAFYTRRTMEDLSSRRELRVQLAEIGHARYGIFNADQWVSRIVPIINKQVDSLDIVSDNRASLRPMAEKALYNLLNQVKEQMAPKPAPAPANGGKPPAPNFAAGAAALMANTLINNLKPRVPEFAGVVLKELGSKDNRQAINNYLNAVIADGARNTFSDVDMTLYKTILKNHNCADAAACRVVLGRLIKDADDRLQTSWMIAVAAAALAFVILFTSGSPLRWFEVLTLLMFCILLLAGGVLSPMLEVEAKVSSINMTFVGSPIHFDEQIFYYQSKTVLEVFRTLIDLGQPDMVVVAILLLTFSVIFPTIKICTLAACLGHPEWLKANRLVRFFALESSKWSMADVMALAIFMSYVAFNGVIVNAMRGLQAPGAQIVIPTDSSKILAGFWLFVGFVLLSLCLSWRLDRDLKNKIQVNQLELSSL